MSFNITVTISGSFEDFLSRVSKVLSKSTEMKMGERSTNEGAEEKKNGQTEEGHRKPEKQVKSPVDEIVENLKEIFSEPDKSGAEVMKENLLPFIRSRCKKELEKIPMSGEFIDILTKVINECSDSTTSKVVESIAKFFS